MDALTELRLRRDAGDLTPGQYGDALALATELPGPAAWRVFVSRTAAALGTAAVVAGAVYLVAWNWAGLGRWSKMGLAGGAVLAAAALATQLGLDRLPGRLAGAASCGFAGALFVLFTQVYQVGADPWELFAAFAVVAVPYAWATRLPVLGAAAVVSAQLAVLLAYAQVHPWDKGGWEGFLVGWVVVDVPLLIGLNAAQRAGAMSRAAAVLAVGVPAVLALVDLFTPGPDVVALLAVAGVTLGVHFVRRDLFPLAWAVVAAIAVLAAWLGRELWPDLRQGTFLVLALFVTTLGGGAAAWLRFLYRRAS